MILKKFLTLPQSVLQNKENSDSDQNQQAYKKWSTTKEKIL